MDITIAEMDSLISQSTNHKIQALLKRYKSIEYFPNHQRDLVANHFGYKAVKRTDTKYFDALTGERVAYKEVEARVLDLARVNRKVAVIIENRKRFSSTPKHQKELILEHIGIHMEQWYISYFKKL